MKINKKTVSIFMVIVLGVMLIPQITFAAWWNPFTWQMPTFLGGNKQEQSMPMNTSITREVEVVNVDDTVVCNGQRWNKCPANQTLVCPKDVGDAYCEEVKTPQTQQTPVVKPVTPKPQPKASVPQVVAPVKVSPVPTPAVMTQQQKEEIAAQQAKALDQQKTQEKIKALQQQILDIKEKYAQDVVAIQQAPIAVEFQQGKINQLNISTNAKISQLNLQIQELQVSLGGSVNADTIGPLPATKQPTNCYFGMGNDGAGSMTCY